METDASGQRGRPGITAEQWNACVDLLGKGRTPLQVKAETGLSLTKIYEVKRNPIKKNAPVACTDEG